MGGATAPPATRAVLDLPVETLEPEADCFLAALELPLATDFEIEALEPMGEGAVFLPAFVAAFELLGGGATLLRASGLALEPEGD